MSTSICPHCKGEIVFINHAWTCLPCWKRWPMGGHKHEWANPVHIDGCHFFSWTYTCAECHAVTCIRCERDPSRDSFGPVWMEIDPEHPCERCIEILKGATVRHETTTWDADGKELGSVVDLQEQDSG